jgi:hypothetical protein
MFSTGSLPSALPPPHRKQAKALQKAYATAGPEAIARVQAQLPHRGESLSDAQLVIARGLGFAIWPTRKKTIPLIQQATFRRPSQGEKITALQGLSAEKSRAASRVARSSEAASQRA